MKNAILTFFTPILLLVYISCDSNSKPQFDSQNSEKEIRTTLEKLLRSIENKDIDLLKSTMSPSGKMELILPNTKTTYTVDEFVKLHEEWFKDSLWTMETKILNIEPGEYIGTATTEAIYKEPNRNGKPYFNHMIVSYVLRKSKDGQWYPIKDHASSLKKSTD